MRAIRFTSFGEPADVLTVENVPAPEPGPGQVLVRVQARPINPSDLFVIRGLYGALPRLPAVPGFEGAGVIVGIGEGVTDRTVGQLVIPSGVSGLWQEYVVVPAAKAIPVPEPIGDRQAATALINPATAWLMLTETLQVESGEWVLQNAANSMVGRHIIRLARRLGFRTINVVRRREVIDDLRALGADEIICEQDENVVARVHALTGGKGVRYALDSVGGVSGARLAASLSIGGTMLVYGAIAGEPLTIHPGMLLFRSASIRGWWLSHWFQNATQEQVQTLFNTLFGLIADGTLNTPIAAEYDLADVREAVIAAERRTRPGKILLVG
ncbi:MAG: zinc-dependent alcohol dehydrogenase family protein [Roseiflexus sp.]|nr:zinc-dependent alcohol dehydrogenase family protein [Roseiflexus sp.]MCS7289988.1 zinc-dependent alcohol dehydrogenase family protein [Roseiflexus sp.]MDW8233456.1 zinc-dependent alcohol dehydrogenase family protein [Roseiflexaceae bacterium]